MSFFNKLKETAVNVASKTKAGIDNVRVERAKDKIREYSSQLSVLKEKDRPSIPSIDGVSAENISQVSAELKSADLAEKLQIAKAYMALDKYFDKLKDSLEISLPLELFFNVNGINAGSFISQQIDSPNISASIAMATASRGIVASGAMIAGMVGLISSSYKKGQAQQAMRMMKIKANIEQLTVDDGVVLLKLLAMKEVEAISNRDYQNAFFGFWFNGGNTSFSVNYEKLDDIDRLAVLCCAHLLEKYSLCTRDRVYSFTSDQEVKLSPILTEKISELIESQL